MKLAVAAVQRGDVSERKASKFYNVPRSTLQQRVNGKRDMKPKLGRKPVFGADDEGKLVDFACNRAEMGIGFGKRQFLTYAADLARKRKIRIKQERLSDKWWRLFKRHHVKLAHRKPEGTAQVRHRLMNRGYVKKYFDELKKVLDETGASPDSVWNMDETGVQLEHRPKKVVARRWSRYLHARTSGNRELITIIAACNAAGKTLPPHMIVKGKSRRVLNGFDSEKAPEGTVMSVSDSGWTKQGIAALWFDNVFLPNIGTHRPQILVFDGHDSHNYVELVETAMTERIVLIELPAHASH